MHLEGELTQRREEGEGGPLFLLRHHDAIESGDLEVVEAVEGVGTEERVTGDQVAVRRDGEGGEGGGEGSQGIELVQSHDACTLQRERLRGREGGRERDRQTSNRKDTQ